MRPILNVSDVPASLAWFESIGWETTFEWSEEGESESGFAGTGCGDVEIFLCRGGQGSRGTHVPAFPFDETTGGVWMSWFLGTPDEVDALHDLLKPGEVTTLPQYMTGLLSVAVLAICGQSLLKSIRR